MIQTWNSFMLISTWSASKNCLNLRFGISLGFGMFLAMEPFDIRQQQGYCYRYSQYQIKRSIGLFPLKNSDDT